MSEKVKYFILGIVVTLIFLIVAFGIVALSKYSDKLIFQNESIAIYRKASGEDLVITITDMLTIVVVTVLLSLVSIAVAYLSE